MYWACDAYKQKWIVFAIVIALRNQALKQGQEQILAFFYSHS
jgi:hypothetical protein